MSISQLRRAIAAALIGSLLLADALPAADTEEQVVHSVDFTEQPPGDAVPWLREKGYELHLDADAIEARFTGDGLVLETDERLAGLFVRALQPLDANRIRVVWGVERYPEGADWENGNYRVPIAVMVSFGDAEIASGSWFVPNAPYFISVFLSENAQPGKAYTANYYHKGGRYFCEPCAPPVGETVTTEFNLDEAFLRAFEPSEVPPITQLAFQMNTKDTRGGARAYLKRIEFLAREADG